MRKAIKRRFRTLLHESKVCDLNQWSKFYIETGSRVRDSRGSRLSNTEKGTKAKVQNDIIEHVPSLTLMETNSTKFLIVSFSLFHPNIRSEMKNPELKSSLAAFCFAFFTSQACLEYGIFASFFCSNLILADKLKKKMNKKVWISFVLITMNLITLELFSLAPIMHFAGGRLR
jgi:hypothetical protein